MSERIKAQEERARIRSAMQKKAERDMALVRRLKWLALGLAVGLVAFVVLFFTTILPILRYNAAMDTLEQGRFDAAVERFRALEDYKDAETMVQESLYRKAQSLLDKERFDESAHAFAALDGYREASTLAMESVYRKAQGLSDAGEGIRAAREFAKVADYRDSAALARELFYQEAQSLLAEGATEEAFLVLSGIPGYRDVDELLSRDDLLDAAEAAAASWAGLEVGDEITWGAYEQDNDLDNGPEPIEWIVLDTDGEYATVVSKYALDKQPYTLAKARCTWETCDLRTWLNDTFYISAFTRGEQAAIPLTEIVAEGNPSSPYDISGGNDTLDMVYLLSISEAYRYFDSDEARICKLTDYAAARYSYASSENATWWWLRNPGNFGSYAAYVFDYGAVSEYGNLTQNTGETVRPAMRIRVDWGR